MIELDQPDIEEPVIELDLPIVENIYEPER